VARLNDMVLIAKTVDALHPTHPIIFVNDAFLLRTGYVRDVILGQGVRVLQGPGTDPVVMERIVNAMENSVSCNTELVIHAQVGDAFWAEIEMVPFARAGEPVSHWVIVGRDITERRAAAAAIHHSAYYDLLTGLPNRRLLMERLETLVVQEPAGCGLSAVLYLDVDNFKNINDSRGHATGDILLAHTAARLRQCVRQCDVVARIGGDEFVVLLEELDQNPANAARRGLEMAHKIRAALAAPFDLDGQHYAIAVSTRPAN
jgi:diguanylate cyclase (GGDEF)-like protein/PAS domain S-box-containing protein